jgi:inosine-uridine nucleoside N-ribohydrolase
MHTIMRYHVLVIAAVVSCGQARTGQAGEKVDGRGPPRKILLDTDPGGDDVLALLWLQSLAKQGVAEIVAVTTVAGNVQSTYTFANASKILDLGGFGHVEVGRSVSRRDEPEDAAYIHGADGMGNLSQTLPAPKHDLSKARYADDVIVEKLSAAPGEITLVAVGPLTNLAAAEKKRPGILAKAQEIVIMGGAFRQKGNVTSHAEFNIHCDPEAAERTFASRGDVVVLPLDVTQQMTLTTDRVNAAKDALPEHRITRFMVDLCQFMSTTSMRYRATEGVSGFHVHDAATLAYLFYPETILLRRARVRVETEGAWTRGQTMFDDRHGPKAEANAWVALHVDAVNLLAILIEDLKVLARGE